MANLKEEIVAWVKDYFEKNGDPQTKALIGISGGKDSSAVAAVCVEALGRDRVVGVLMPNGVQSDISDSKRLCDFLGIKNFEVNIKGGFDGLTDEIIAKTGCELTAQYRTNTPSRLRMATLYGVAAIIGNCRISNNGNKSERIMGYFTLWGDGAGDFAPLTNLYVSEVVELGMQLGLPADLVKKTPSDGMCGKSDEDNLGFTYRDVELVCRGRGSEVAPSVREKITDRINGMAWKGKLLGLPAFVPSQKVLVIVDAQRDFIDGTLAVGIDKWNVAKENIKSLIKAENYDRVIFTRDAHPRNHCSFKSQGGLWPAHCVLQTPGAELDDELTDLFIQRDVIYKGCNANLEEYGVDVLADTANDKGEFHFVGLCYDFCVSSCAKMTARNHPDAKVIIKRAATVAIDENANVDFEGLPIIVE